MSISEHANLAECLDRAILGHISQLQSSIENVKNKSRKRALWSTLYALSEISAVELPGFLNFKQKFAWLQNGPVWDVYYYTAPGRETRAKNFSVL